MIGFTNGDAAWHREQRGIKTPEELRFEASKQVAKLQQQLAAHEAVIKQMREALSLIERCESPNGSIYLSAGECSNIATKALTLQPTTKHLDAYVKELLGEPVAWMCSNESLIRLGYRRVTDAQFGDWDVPLYTLKEQK